MVEQNQLSENVQKLERLLVKEFRLLQELVETTRQEQQALLKTSDQLMQLVEDKEVQLDELGLVEGNRSQVVQTLMVGLGIQSETSSVSELLPHLDADTAGRIKHLSEGLNSLVLESRELNHNNQAVAAIKLDWVKAVQNLLIGLSQTDTSYYHPNSVPPPRDAPGQTLNFRV
jgi:hypothetical protein